MSVSASLFHVRPRRQRVALHMAPHDILPLALDLTAGFNSESAFRGLVEDQEGHGVAVVLWRDHRQRECEHPDPTRHGPRRFG
eukprot:2661428-Heterocapsa_arctica.AAC.1